MLSFIIVRQRFGNIRVASVMESVRFTVEEVNRRSNHQTKFFGRLSVLANSHDTTVSPLFDPPNLRTIFLFASRNIDLLAVINYP